MEDSTLYRHKIGLIVIVGSFSLLAAMLFITIPVTNKDVLTTALGILLGWGGAVVSYEFGSSQAERKAAMQGIKTDDVQAVTVTNSADNPVPVESGEGA